MGQLSIAAPLARSARRGGRTVAVVVLLATLVVTLLHGRVTGALAAPRLAAATTGGSVPGGVNFGSSYEQTFDQASASTQATVMSHVAASGATWIRVDIPMSGIEWQPGSFNWYVSPEITQAISHGIHVLGVIGFPAPWAGGTANPNLTAFAAFAKAAAAHFGPMGVHAYEVWNEPNNGLFAPGGVVDPAAYVSMLKALYPAIKAGDPASTVVSGGLAPEPDNGTKDLSPLTFLTDMYADGAHGYFDALGDHPYSYPDVPTQPDAWNPFQYLPQLHALMAAHGDGGKQIWYTEYGAPTAGGANPVTPATEALMYTQAFAVARTWTWSGPIFAFDWVDGPDGQFGLNTSTGTAKPALAAFQAAINSTTVPSGGPTNLASGVDLSQTVFSGYSAAGLAAAGTQITQAHLSWVRINVSMASSEWPVGSYHWPDDPEVKWAASLGLHIDVVLGWAPSWANSASGHLDPTKFAAFAQAAAAHFSTLGVHAYEIWNNPNTSSWTGGVSPGNYTAVLKAAYPAIHAGDTQATVLVGSLAQVNDTATALSAITFVTDLYTDGAAGSFDAVGIEPMSNYVASQPNANNPWQGELPTLRQLMVNKGDTTKKVWITGYGIAANDPTSEANQANYLNQAFQQASTWSWMGPFIVFEWQDTPTYWGYYGLTTTAGVAKPALATLGGLSAGALLAPQGVPGGVVFGGSYEKTFNALSPIEQDQIMQGIAASGARWIRVDVPMSGEEWQAGSFSWTCLPEVTAAAHYGLQVDAVIANTAPWAKNSDGSPNQAALVGFAQAAVAELSPLGVHTYEVWNQPNVGSSWGAPVNVAAYTALLKAAYPVIKAADPTATVITGGLSPAPDAANLSTLSPKTFVTQLYADGAKGFFDAIGDEPYSYPTMPATVTAWNPWNTTLPQIHAAMTANGDTAKKIWLVAFGAPSAGASGVGESNQATMITQGFALAASMSYVGPLFVFAWQDSADGTFGLNDSTGAPKPALTAFELGIR